MLILPTESCQTLASISDLDTQPIHHLSANEDGRRILATCGEHSPVASSPKGLIIVRSTAKEAFLLDGLQLDKIRTLHGAEGVGLQQVHRHSGAI